MLSLSTQKVRWGLSPLIASILQEKKNNQDFFQCRYWKCACWPYFILFKLLTNIFHTRASSQHCKTSKWINIHSQVLSLYNTTLLSTHSWRSINIETLSLLSKRVLINNLSSFSLELLFQTQKIIRYSSYLTNMRPQQMHTLHTGSSAGCKAGHAATAARGRTPLCLSGTSRGALTRKSCRQITWLSHRESLHPLWLF